MNRMLLCVASCLVVLSFTCVASQADDDKDKKFKYSIEDVMKKGFKGDLCKKVARGKAKKEEVKTLIAMLTDMSKQKPHKGDAKSWKAKCDALLAAAKGVQQGKAGAGAKLGKAANCKACHMVHKK
jgi:hypothetical protein